MTIFSQLSLSQGYLFSSLICMTPSFINLIWIIFIFIPRGTLALQIIFSLLVPSLSSNILMSQLFSLNDAWIFCKMVSFVHYFTASKNHVVDQEQKNGEKIYNDHFPVLLYNSLITVRYRYIFFLLNLLNQMYAPFSQGQAFLLKAATV